MGGAKHSVLCVGVNPAFDITMKLTSLEYGEVSRVYAESRRAAGKAYNVCRELDRLAAKDHFDLTADHCCILGRDNLSEYLADCRADGISCRYVEAAGKTRENLTILVDNAESELKINRSGFRCDADIVSALRDVILSKPYEHIIFSGSMPEGMSAEQYVQLMRAAKETGARLTIDTTALSLEQLCELSPWLYKPNDTELCRLFGLDLLDVLIDDSPEAILTDCAERLCGKGVENVLLTLGAKGLALIYQHNGAKLAERVAASGEKLKDSTGAGDRALAGFVYAHMRGCSPRECATAADASGSLCG